MAGAPVIRINGLSTVWVNAQLPESQAALVARGSTVEAHTTASPGATFKGRVLAVLPNIDLQTRTLTARIEVDNAEEKLAPGMFVSLSFIGTDREPQLVVPSEAVIATGTRSVVIVVRDNEAFEVVAVSVGAESNGMSTILGGLQEGQSIVLSGQFLIDSEASLRSALDRLSGEQVTP
jgi:Cu(I)/Ag(I) efflux system membrane fusion protein